MRIRALDEGADYEILVSAKEKRILKEAMFKYLTLCNHEDLTSSETLFGGLIAVDLDLKGDEH